MPDHWDEVYARDTAGLSWTQLEPSLSLELIEALGVVPPVSVVDVGGGASPLAARLLDLGFADVTVLDVAETSLAAARLALGERAARVTWLAEDVRSWRPTRRFDLWHDRALLHFFVDAADRARYLDTLRGALAPAGAVVIATFAPDGPETCSRLPVERYDAGALASLLGPGFALVVERREEHVTPSGRAQAFTWAAFRRRS